MKKFLPSRLFSLALLAILLGVSTFSISLPAYAASASYHTLQTAGSKNFLVIPNAGPRCTPRASISEPWPFDHWEFNGGGDNCTKSDVIDAYADLFQLQGSRWVIIQEAQASCTSCYGIRAYGFEYNPQDGGKYKVQGTYVASDSTGTSSGNVLTRCVVFHKGTVLSFC